MEMQEICADPEEDNTPAPAAVAEGGGGGGLLGTTQLLVDHEDGPLQAAAAAGGGEGGGLGDRRLQAASFFLVWGCCVLINATILNPGSNLEHKFVGFVVLTTGAWLALLTLAGAGAGRAAAGAERFLRGLFF